MNWQKLGPMLHVAAKQYLQDPSRQNELELLLCIQAGDNAGNHTEWDDRARYASGLNDEIEPPPHRSGLTQVNDAPPDGMRDA